MIIKKKYTSIKRQSDEPKIEETIEVNEVQPLSDVQTKNAETEIKEETNQEVKEEKDVQQPKEDKKDEKTAKEKKKKSDLNLSLDDITFEQREERREGTRRRGYRRTQDRNIVSRAQQDAQSIKEIAKQDGYKEGINLAQKDIEELKEKFAEFYNYKDVVFEKVSECIMEVSVEIAKKILNKEIETDKTAVLSIIKGVVEEVNKTENKITLKVMPKDVELVRDKVPELFSGNYFEAKISVVPDNTIKEGGVIVETSNGIIDATIETQVAIIEKALKNKEES